MREIIPSTGFPGNKSLLLTATTIAAAQICGPYFFGNAGSDEAGVTKFWAHDNCAKEIDEGASRAVRGLLEPDMYPGEGRNVKRVSALRHQAVALVHRASTGNRNTLP
jgi:hypothetical protein